MTSGSISSELSPAAEVVFNNVDLLTEILLHLRARSLLRFRSVSKHWLSLISHPQFPVCHTLQNPNPSITGLYFYCNEQLNSVSFHGHRSLPSLSFLDGLGEQYTTTVRVKDSRNGLLLCSYHDRSEINSSSVSWWGFVVANPTTNKFTRIPDRELYYCSHSNLIFDPSESPHYKIVTFYQTSIFNQPNPIDVYSSQSGCWKRILAPTRCFNHGVFWNGAIHWLTARHDLLRFKIDGEVMEVVSIPSRSKNCKYLGECGGSLILINVPLFAKKLGIRRLEVLEMNKDDCSWIVKCVVDLRPLLAKFPEIEKVTRYQKFDVLFVARSENEKDFSLVLSIPRRIVRYNPKCEVWDVLCNFEPGASMKSTVFIDASPFVETLFPVCDGLSLQSLWLSIEYNMLQVRFFSWPFHHNINC